MAPVVCALLAAAVAAGPAAAAIDRPAGNGPKVIGGTDAAPGQFPWLAAIVRHDDPRDYDAQYCGGTVIAPLWILTASHCVIDGYFIEEDEHGIVDIELERTSPNDVDVVLGKTDLRAGGGERHRAAEIVLHPNAGLAEAGDELVPTNDLALVRLRTPTRVPPVQLASPEQQALWSAGTAAEVVGWGSIVDPGGKTPPDYPAALKHASIPVVADSTCAAPNIHGALYQPASMLCAGAPLMGVPGRGACYGDSGGPLVVRNATDTDWIQAGIVSWGGATCASSGQPGVFARVSALSAFVRATIGYGPFAGASRFVRGQYRDFAFGPPSPSDLAARIAVLSAGGAPHDLIASLDDAPTWQRTAGTVDRLYRAAFGRRVDDSGMAHWIAAIRAGWRAGRVASALAGSSEFAARYGTLDDAGYVGRLYQNVLGRSGDAGGTSYWVRRLQAGMSRGQLLAVFADSSEFRTRVAAASHVVTTWYGMLRHVPTADEVAYWTGRPRTGLIDTLLASARYASRN